MSAFDVVKLEVSAAGTGHVWVNGVEVCCSKLSIQIEAGKLTKIDMQLLADLSGSVEVAKPE